MTQSDGMSGHSTVCWRVLPKRSHAPGEPMPCCKGSILEMASFVWGRFTRYFSMTRRRVSPTATGRTPFPVGFFRGIRLASQSQLAAETGRSPVSQISVRRARPSRRRLDPDWSPWRISWRWRGRRPEGPGAQPGGNLRMTSRRMRFRSPISSSRISPHDSGRGGGAWAGSPVEDARPLG